MHEVSACHCLNAHTRTHDAVELFKRIAKFKKINMHVISRGIRRKISNAFVLNSWHTENMN